MRSESEVRAMLDELRAMELGQMRANGGKSAPALRTAVALLQNVLDGPREPGWCGCMGPEGACPCMMLGLKGRP